MKKLTFAQVRQLKADLVALERLANWQATRLPMEMMEEIEQKINHIKTLLSLHYGKDQSSY